MSDPTPPPSPSRPPPSTSVAVAVAWLVVGLPAAWGVYQTALKSKNLFSPPSAPAASTAPAAH